jgi:hypothetical protein
MHYDHLTEYDTMRPGDTLVLGGITHRMVDWGSFLALGGPYCNSTMIRRALEVSDLNRCLTPNSLAMLVCDGKGGTGLWPDTGDAKLTTRLAKIVQDLLDPNTQPAVVAHIKRLMGVQPKAKPEAKPAIAPEHDPKRLPFGLVQELLAALKGANKGRTTPFRWAACDDDGEWFCYEEAPIKETNWWTNQPRGRKNWAFVCEVKTLPPCGWAESATDFGELLGLVGTAQGPQMVVGVDLAGTVASVTWGPLARFAERLAKPKTPSFISGEKSEPLPKLGQVWKHRDGDLFLVGRAKEGLRLFLLKGGCTGNIWSAKSLFGAGTPGDGREAFTLVGTFNEVFQKREPKPAEKPVRGRSSLPRAVFEALDKMYWAEPQKWSKIKWVAMDASGEWYGYGSKMPKQGTRAWYSAEWFTNVDVPGWDRAGWEWQDTLTDFSAP